MQVTAALGRIQRIQQHLTSSRHAAAVIVGADDLSGFYVAHGQQTPGPPHEPELHGAPMADTYSMLWVGPERCLLS